MASISAILTKENEQEPCIWLYREGIFWKAYQYSAFRVISRQGNLKLKKKWIKIVACEIVSLGFPDVTLNRIFSPDEIEQISEKLIRIKDQEIDRQAFYEWFTTIPTMETQSAEVSDHSCSVLHEQNRILRRIKEFRLEESTPIDCVTFLASIRKELTLYGNL